jgi:presenilin-like A22 family membrane protease
MEFRDAHPAPWHLPIPESSDHYLHNSEPFIGAMAVALSQLGDAGMSTIGQVADNFFHGSWVYAIPVPLCSALGGTLVGKRFGSYDESAAIAANAEDP